MKIFTLIENTNLKNSALYSEHGISFYIETREKNFIFDCGQSGFAWKNAEKLNLDLTKINFAVLSHSHYDHAGGFPALLKHVTPKKIYTHDAVGLTPVLNLVRLLKVHLKPVLSGYM